MAKVDMQDELDVNTPKDVSRLQDVLVTLIIALIGTAVSLGLYLQAGFGMVPSLCVGSGLFIWLLSAHFLITRMRLKRLVQGRLSQLTRDVKKLKSELQVTELLAEGHNELFAGHDALEKAIRTIVGRMDDYDSRLKVLQKVSKITLEKPKREELNEQNSKLKILSREFETLSLQLQQFEHRYDHASQQQYNLMKAELDVLEFVVQQLSVSGDGERSHYTQKALEAISGLRQIPELRALAQPQSPEALLSPFVATAQLKKDVLPLSALPPLEKVVPKVSVSKQAKSALPPSSLDALADAAALDQSTHSAFGGRHEQSLTAEVKQQTNSFSAPQLDQRPSGYTQSELEPAASRPSALMQANSGDLAKADGDYSLLAVVNEAIEANRIELYLQPIVGLPERELVFYEAFSRLRNDIGQLILPRDFIPVAEVAELAPIIDNQIILRSIQVIQRLVEKGKGRTVFCNLSLTSLRDADFFSEFMDFIEANKWLNDYLVFEFSQKALEKAGSQEFERMTAISNLGFKFSLDQITRLDLDFKALAERHFGYVKINASLLLGNMEGAKAQIHSADLDHFLNRLNITMIVDKVEREAIVRQLRDYNVNYAQGDLFCEPKPVRPEVFGSAQAVVAA